MRKPLNPQSSIGLVLVFWASVAAAEFSGSAFVQDDGSLRIRNRLVQLWGIYIPPTVRSCYNFQRPPVCGSRATLALELKIDGFVHCEEREQLKNGTVAATCFAGQGKFETGTDLTAYLLSQGWALVAAETSPEYRALERIAHANGLGVWGLPGAVVP